MEFTAKDIEELTLEKVAEWKESLYNINRRFLNLAKVENGKYIKKLIELGFDINHRDWIGCTPVFYIEKNALEELLRSGAEVNVVSKHGKTPLIERVSKQETDSVKLLLEYGADVNRIDGYGYSVLRTACVRGNSQIAEMLIDAGADIEVMDERGLTPLAAVAQMYKRERERINPEDIKKVVTTLLKRGANPNAKSMNGFDVIRWAIMAENIEVLKLLIEAGADVNNPDRLGRSLLGEAARQGNLGLAKILLDGGAEIEFADNMGYTPLISTAGILEKQESCHMASSVEEVVGFLLKNGADVNARSLYGGTAMHNAASWGNVECLKLLIAAGGDVNAVDYIGYTPLMTVCLSSYDPNRSKEEFIKILLDHGADAKHQDDDGRTALSLLQGCKDRRFISDEMVARLEKLIQEG